MGVFLILVSVAVKHRLEGAEASRSHPIVEAERAADISDDALGVRAAEGAFSHEIGVDFGREFRSAWFEGEIERRPVRLCN